MGEAIQTKAPILLQRQCTLQFTIRDSEKNSVVTDSEDHSFEAAVKRAQAHALETGLQVWVDLDMDYVGQAANVYALDREGPAHKNMATWQVLADGDVIFVPTNKTALDPSWLAKAKNFQESR